MVMLRPLFRLTPDEIANTSAAALLYRAQICSPRARIAVDRLLYTQRLWQFGPEMLQPIMHREAALTPDSWLVELKHYLQLLAHLEPTGLPPLIPLSPTTETNHINLTDLSDFWQSGAPFWKACIKGAWKRHVRQETMIIQVHGMHKQFFQILCDAGNSTFPSSPFNQPEARQYHYPYHCGNQFTMPQDLATHRRVRHGEFAIEYDLLEGITYPEYFKDF